MRQGQTRADERPLLKVPEVARMASVSPRFLYYAIERGELAAVRFGRQGRVIRIRPEVADRFVGNTDEAAQAA